MDSAELYRCRPPDELWVPLLVILAEVDEGIPSETYIELSVQGLKGGIVGGLLDMRAEDLKGWL